MASPVVYVKHCQSILSNIVFDITELSQMPVTKLTVGKHLAVIIKCLVFRNKEHLTVIEHA